MDNQKILPNNNFIFELGLINERRANKEVFRLMEINWVILGWLKT